MTKLDKYMRRLLLGFMIIFVAVISLFVGIRIATLTATPTQPSPLEESAGLLAPSVSQISGTQNSQLFSGCGGYEVAGNFQSVVCQGGEGVIVFTNQTWVSASYIATWQYSQPVASEAICQIEGKKLVCELEKGEFIVTKEITK